MGHLVRKGTGGRSSVSGVVAAVFGATGFLGRYLVQQLAKVGSQVLDPFRGSEDSHRHLKLMGDLGQIVPMKYNPRDENSIKAVLAKANVVINLIGREYETRNFGFEEVNHHMVENLALVIVTIADEDGNYLQDAWEHILTCVSRFEHLHLLGEGAPRDAAFFAIQQKELDKTKQARSNILPVLRKKGPGKIQNAASAVRRGSYDSAGIGGKVAPGITSEQMSISVVFPFIL